jgi:hypothetical protein
MTGPIGFLMGSNIQLAKMIDAFEAERLAITELLLHAEDDLARQREANEFMTREVDSLRGTISSLNKFNTTAIERCAQKQRTINQLQESSVSREEVNDLKASLKETGLKLIEASK